VTSARIEVFSQASESSHVPMFFFIQVMAASAVIFGDRILVLFS
jgi:hypothetical protein